MTVLSNGKEDLYEDDSDRAYLLRLLSESAVQHGARVYLFCLMRNQFHLVEEGSMLAQVCGVNRSELQAHRRSSCGKGLACRMLVKCANLIQREVAARLGLTTGSGVSYQTRKLHRQI
ncbi:MAG: hypothetical protein WCR06_01935 [bacterium]